MESKPVLWFANERKANTFFFRSPFRSWSFLFNIGLSSAVILAFAGATWKYWDRLNQKTSSWLIVSVLAVQCVVYPFLRALRLHRKINDLYAAGYVTEQTAGSPLDEILQVADNAMNESLGSTAFTFGLLLFCLFRWKLG